jgi:uncharacterized phage protein gp47/JayE
MAITFISATGFTRGRLADYLAADQASMQAIFGSAIDLTPESIDGQFLAALAEAKADLASLAEAVYNTRSRAGAIGAALSRLARLNGVTRKSAGFSIASITVTGTGGTVIPQGSLVGSHAVPSATFQTLATITVGTPLPTDQVEAVVAGPLPAGAGGAGDLTVPLTVIAGWTGVTNAAPASAGTLAETDPELRARDEASVALPSQGILDGLVAALLAVPNVTQAIVPENPTGVTDSNGLPPHSINAIVKGGASTDIANALWLKKSLGVTQVGVSSQVITDSQGFPHTMRWDTQTDVPIYVVVTLATPVSSGTKTAIQNAIKAWGDANSFIGVGIGWTQIFVPLFTVPGLPFVSSVAIGTAPSPPIATNVTVAFNALASFDTSRITVNP